ncbi:unnamed protein product, partial [Symbiodinium sp. CCMP2456]
MALRSPGVLMIRPTGRSSRGMDSLGGNGTLLSSPPTGTSILGIVNLGTLAKLRLVRDVCGGMRAGTNGPCVDVPPVVVNQVGVDMNETLPLQVDSKVPLPLGMNVGTKVHIVVHLPLLLRLLPGRATLVSGEGECGLEDLAQPLKNDYTGVARVLFEPNDVKEDLISGRMDWDRWASAVELVVDWSRSGLPSEDDMFFVPEEEEDVGFLQTTGMSTQGDIEDVMLVQLSVDEEELLADLHVPDDVCRDIRDMLRTLNTHTMNDEGPEYRWGLLEWLEAWETGCIHMDR